MRTLFIALMLMIVSQQIHAQVSVEGEVKKALRLTSSDFQNMTSVELQAKGKAGDTHTFRGVTLFSILESAGITLGKALHGDNLRKYVLVTGSDNYSVIYALTELDPDFTSNVVLLATHVDGKPLPDNEGPFRLINAADKRPALWVRQVQSIKVLLANQ